MDELIAEYAGVVVEVLLGVVVCKIGFALLAEVLSL